MSKKHFGVFFGSQCRSSLSSSVIMFWSSVCRPILWCSSGFCTWAAIYSSLCPLCMYCALHATIEGKTLWAQQRHMGHGSKVPWVTWVMGQFE